GEVTRPGALGGRPPPRRRGEARRRARGRAAARPPAQAHPLLPDPAPPRVAASPRLVALPAARRARGRGPRGPRRAAGEGALSSVRPNGRARLGAALEERSVVVVCGSGGVGKTTTAASLGLRAALPGGRALVCTTDPSRRLATSLGVSQLSSRPRSLDLRRMGPVPGGALHAMMLDTKSTFDALVERFAPSAVAKRRILENRF